MTIYLDVTKTLELGLQTGIQRVVRRIATNAACVAAERDLVVIPVVARDGSFYPLSLQGSAALASSTPAEAGAHVATRSRWRARLRRLLLRWPALHLPLLERKTNARFRHQQSSLLMSAPVRIGAGDVLVLLDLLFGGSPAVRASAIAHRAGAVVVPVIYDMIPVTHPALMTRQIRYSFARSLLAVTKWSVGALSISRFSADQLAGFLGRCGRTQPVGNFYLGDDIGAAGRPPRDGETRFDHSPRYLMVGSIEPRKGHALVLDAFERLWASGHRATLTVVGNAGWNMQDFLDRHAAHAQRDIQFFLIQGAADDQLAAIMRDSSALISASSVEGFGLPIVESLAQGLPVIAADIPVFREIAGDHAVYFDRDDPATLDVVLQTFVDRQSEYRRMATDFKWIDWLEATRRFFDALDDVLARVGAART